MHCCCFFKVPFVTYEFESKMALAISKCARSLAKIRLHCRLGLYYICILSGEMTYMYKYVHEFFSFQVVAATNRVDILDPALLRSGLSSIIMRFFFVFPVYARCFHFLKCRIGIVPLNKNFNAGPGYWPLSCRTQF